MKFRNILRKLLNENDAPTGNAKFDTFYDNLVANGKISFENFKKLMEIDPTTENVPDGFNWDTATKQDFKSIKIGKFLKFLLQIFLKPNAADVRSNHEVGTQEYLEDLRRFQKKLTDEDVDMVKNLLLKYDNASKKIVNDKDKNILNISSIEELTNMPVKGANEGEQIRLVDFEEESTGMSKFDNFYNNLVAKNKISFQDLKKLIKLDPTTENVPNGFNWATAKKEDFKDIKIGKFLKWLTQVYLNPNPTDVNSDYEVGTQEYLDDLHRYQERITDEDAELLETLLIRFDKYNGRIVPEKIVLDKNGNPILDKDNKPKTVDQRNILNISGIEELSNLPIRMTAEGDETRLIEFGGVVVPPSVQKKEGIRPEIRFKHPGAEILKVGSEYTLVKISNKGALGSQAASHYGGYYLGSSNPSSNETNWCTSPENSSNFKTYIQEAPLYIFLANDDKGQVGVQTGLPKERYQVHLGKSFQAKDRLNTNFDFENQLANGKLAEFKEFFREELKKGVSNYSFSAENKAGSEWIVKLNSPNIRVMQMYTKIYGDADLQQQNPVELLDEALGKVPSGEDCTTLTIVNPTQINLNLKFSDKILSFTALRTLSIQNIAKSLPDGFGVFKNLAFLSLTNNKELTKLPDGVEDCKLIVFISLTGSENVVLSPDQLDVFEQEKDDYGRIPDNNFWVPK